MPLPLSRRASKKCTRTFGWSALCSMIWDTSIWRLACSNRWKIRSAQNCYPCLRYVVSPMPPGRTLKEWSGRVDLNHRPPGPEPGALARLSHAPTLQLRPCVVPELDIQVNIRALAGARKSPRFPLGRSSPKPETLASGPWSQNKGGWEAPASRPLRVPRDP